MQQHGWQKQYVERKKSNTKSNAVYFYLYDIYKYTELTYSDNNQNSSCLSVDWIEWEWGKFGEWQKYSMYQ